MIILRKIKNEDYADVKFILEKEGIKENFSQGITYVLIDSGDIQGVGKISFENNHVVLNYIVVNKKNRGLNLGDSILRALLSKCRSIGIEKVYYHEYNDYLLKKGFINNKDSYKDIYKLYIDIKKFLNKSCCCDKDGF